MEDEVPTRGLSWLLTHSGPACHFPPPSRGDFHKASPASPSLLAYGLGIASQQRKEEMSLVRVHKHVYVYTVNYPLSKLPRTQCNHSFMYPGHYGAHSSDAFKHRGSALCYRSGTSPSSRRGFFCEVDSLRICPGRRAMEPDEDENGDVHESARRQSRGGEDNCKKQHALYKGESDSRENKRQSLCLRSAPMLQQQKLTKCFMQAESRITLSGLLVHTRMQVSSVTNTVVCNLGFTAHPF